MSLMLFESNDKESKMSNSSSSSSGGIGLCGMVFCVFLFLKLAEIGAVATWSWWWVTAPLWMPAVFVLSIITTVVAVMLLVMGICALLGKKRPKLRLKTRR